MHKDNDNTIQLNNINFSYKNRNILENVDLLIEKGEFASIVGPNGGGKTTLIKLILGLLKPDKGNIRVFGKSPKKARQQVGYMPQYAHLDMDFPASVMDVVLMGRLKRSNLWFSKTDRIQAINAIDEVGMSACINKGFNELSGGQKQRILIARALCNNPDILLLDEPTANVDHQTEENLFSTLKKLNSKMTILLVSHDLGFVSKYVKSVICVNRQVVIHPTTLMNGAIIKDIYNGDLKMVRHDHRCSNKGHNHD
ncbi:MAG: ABC transporter ATP-binding protein [Desulfobacula sp.]|jgi:zinc transport system ATP-binding protein|uniref:metal ABC transporter ATP-binding protein n=1 Tax=Desulfobacula sp. TaxID=2593537 RepID=UPI001D6E18B9|nr:ABC transporter ATP-binding protein [Desulfobacula sp.]MBT3487062.1 ABC transporter ATP-binding protein [Desulfobacula sp.]MBT3806842.1 ABC transporter ATP-binding protein [Desulfobacula sp.]MBT4026785.1 ABC transporter ATP-binding protein [Desulfobacula sp.]MBT4199048.1 ABC transporter ATP-binding protein [Desulfobacula sp.]